MARRQQTQYDPQGGNLRPEAAPTANAPFVPRLAPPTLFPVQELAGLSNALAEISLQQAEKDNKVARQQGLDAAAAAPMDTVGEVAQAGADLDAAEAKVKAQQDAFAKAVSTGKIHSSGNPWARVGFVEGSAHKIMAQYDAELQGRLAEITATTDAAGNPVFGADPLKIIQETWQKYASNPMLTDTYGSRVAQPSKAEIDAKFTAQGLRKRSEEQTAATTEWAENTLSAKFVAMSATGHTPTSVEFKEIGDFLTEVRRKGGLENPRQSVARALDGAASQVDLNDDGTAGGSRAAAMLRQLLDAPVGTTTVGQDAVVGAKVRDLIAQYDRLHGDKVGDQARKEAAEKNLALEHAEREALKRIQEENKAGNGDALGVAEQYAQTLEQSQEFGEMTPFAVDHVRKLALAQKSLASSTEAETLMADMSAGGDTEGLMNAARSLLRSGRMRGEDYARLVAKAEEQTSLKPLLEGSVAHNESMGELRAAATMPNIPLEIAGELRSELSAEVDKYREDATAAARAAQQQPEEKREEYMREWRAQNAPKLRETIRQKTDDFRKAREEALAQANDLLFHASSPEAVLKANPTLFSEREMREIRQTASVVTDRQRLFDTPEFDNAERFVLDQVREKYKDDPQLPDIEQATKRELRLTTAGRLDAELPTTDPGGQRGLVQRVTDEVAPQVLERVAQSNLVRFAKAARPGAEGVPEAKQLLDTGAANLSVSERATKATTAADRAAALTTAVNPNVPQEVRDLQRGFLGGDRTGPFGIMGRVSADNVLDRAYTETLRITADPKLSDKDKGQAVVDMLGATGISAEEALAGKVTLTPSPAWRRKTLDYLKSIDPRVDVAGRYKETRAMLERGMNEKVEVELKGAIVNIYATPLFKTEAEFRVWTETREADLRKLARQYGVPDGDKAFTNWLAHQKEAVRRLNVDAD